MRRKRKRKHWKKRPSTEKIFKLIILCNWNWLSS
jgi:hypothetical protein